MAGAEHQKYSHIRGDYLYKKYQEHNGKNYYVKRGPSGDYKLLFSNEIDNWAVCGIKTNQVKKCVLKSVQAKGEIGQFLENILFRAELYFYFYFFFYIYCL